MNKGMSIYSFIKSKLVLHTKAHILSDWVWLLLHTCTAASQCNPTFAKNGRSGASPIPGFVPNCYVIVMNTGICYV